MRKHQARPTNDRPRVHQADAGPAPGDVVVVVKLDRLARSSRDLQNILHDLQEMGCGFVSLGESWCDTTTEVGRLIMTIMGGIAEFERGLIRKRCEEGIERAKRKGQPSSAGRLHSITASGGASPSVTLAERQWQSWRASTSAVKRRFGGRSDECPLPNLRRPRISK